MEYDLSFRKNQCNVFTIFIMIAIPLYSIKAPFVLTIQSKNFVEIITSRRIKTLRKKRKRDSERKGGRERERKRRTHARAHTEKKIEEERKEKDVAQSCSTVRELRKYRIIALKLPPRLVVEGKTFSKK